jgi:hypothetical protein
MRKPGSHSRNEGYQRAHELILAQQSSRFADDGLDGPPGVVLVGLKVRLAGVSMTPAEHSA